MKCGAVFSWFMHAPTPYSAIFLLHASALAPIKIGFGMVRCSVVRFLWLCQWSLNPYLWICLNEVRKDSIKKGGGLDKFAFVSLLDWTFNYLIWKSIGVNFWVRVAKVVFYGIRMIMLIPTKFKFLYIKIDINITTLVSV